MAESTPGPVDLAGPFDLTGRTALVTGASRGIGEAMAVGLAGAGAHVIGTARSAAALQRTRARIEERGGCFEPLAAELGDRAGTDALVAAIGDRRLDVLVLNAGSIRRASASSYADDAWDEMLGVHLDAPFRLARSLGAGMLARGEGRIIFVGSMQSFQGGTGIIGYAAAKTGLVGVVRALANEWAASGVNVNAIAPGYIETGMTSLRHSDTEQRALVEARIPAGRWGSPDDLAGAAVFLAAPASAYVHGVVLPVDGGWLVR